MFNFIANCVLTERSTFLRLHVSWFLVNGVTTFYHYMSNVPSYVIRTTVLLLLTFYLTFPHTDGDSANECARCGCSFIWFTAIYWAASLNHCRLLQLMLLSVVCPSVCHTPAGFTLLKLLDRVEYHSAGTLTRMASSNIVLDSALVHPQEEETWELEPPAKMCIVNCSQTVFGRPCICLHSLHFVDVKFFDGIAVIWVLFFLFL